MEVLVDTHAVIWAMTDESRLGARAQQVLADPETAVHVSAATAWEVSTKHRIGKLPQGEWLVYEYEDLLRRWYAFTLPIEAGDALLAGGLDWEHRDPFDRMIAAQATRRGWPLVSRDPAFGELPGMRRIW